MERLFMKKKSFAFLITAIFCAGALYAGQEVSLRFSRAGTDGEFTPRFTVLGTPTANPKIFIRADSKFSANAASARVAINKNNLEVFITCTHPQGMQAQGGDEVLSGDYAEFFIQPSPASPVYFHYAVNADGKKCFSKYSSPGVQVKSWKSGAAATVHKTGKYFLITLRIPCKELEGADWTPGSEMRGNIVRTGDTAGGVSCWSRVEKNYHDPATFGVFIIESRKEYFKRRLAPMKQQIQSGSAEIKRKADEILKRADNPHAWKMLVKMTRELESTLKK